MRDLISLKIVNGFDVEVYRVNPTSYTYNVVKDNVVVAKENKFGDPKSALANGIEVARTLDPEAPAQKWNPLRRNG